jgi:cytochrome c
MRWVRGVGSISALAVAASFLLAHVHPFGDAGLYAAKAAAQAPIMHPSSIPTDARALLTAKCADCHSAQTNAPVYAHFAPISWLMERDILEARKHMNLSQWDTYTPDEQETLKAKIVQQTKSREMPLLQYRMIHWNTRITDADVQVLALWAHITSAPASDIAQATGQGDPLRGKQVFEKRCTGCHALETNREGPKLMGVFGRPTGSVPGFPYSGALASAHMVWNDQSLEKWLADPDAFLPGNNMDFHVAKPQERKDLVAFFKQNSTK